MAEENQIIKECLNGNVESFNYLVLKYQSSLLRMAYRFLADWDDAKDATQEAFVKAYCSLKSFQQKRRFSTWLYRILINVCLDKLKSADHRKKTSLNTLRKPGDTKDKLDTLSQLAESELLQKAIAQLPLKRRRIFILVELEGFSSVETAEILNCSESTVRVTLMKAREQLRKTYLALNKL